MSFHKVKNLIPHLAQAPIVYKGTWSKEEKVLSASTKSTKPCLPRWLAIIPPIDKPWAPSLVPGVCCLINWATALASSLAFWKHYKILKSYSWTGEPLIEAKSSVVPYQDINPKPCIELSPVTLVSEVFSRACIRIAEYHSGVRVIKLNLLLLLRIIRTLILCCWVFLLNLSRIARDIVAVYHVAILASYKELSRLESNLQLDFDLFNASKGLIIEESFDFLLELNLSHS